VPDVYPIFSVREKIVNMPESSSLRVHLSDFLNKTIANIFYGSDGGRLGY
jgi:hypothetical protein